MKRLILTVFISCYATLLSFSQTENKDDSLLLNKDDVSLTFKRKSGNLFIDTQIDTCKVKLMLESGTPGLILDEELYGKIKDKSGFNIKESHRSYRTVIKTEKIKYQGTCKINVGNILYDGPVFIMERSTDKSIPLQFVKHPKSKKSYISFDNNKNRLIVHKRLNKSVSHKKYIAFHYNKDGEPTVNTRLYFTNYNTDMELIGNFIIDFGNASLLALNTNLQEVNDSIQNRNVRLDIAKDKNSGRIVGKGIYAPSMTLLDNSFEKVSIGVTDKLKSLKEFGYIGYKVFKRPVTFDFEKNKLYYW